MQTAEQTNPLQCGEYKKWQLTRLQKLYSILHMEFNAEELVKKSREDLRKLLEKANGLAKLQKIQF